MNNYLTSLVIISSLALASCSKAESDAPAKAPEQAKTTTAAPAPAAKPTSGAASADSTLAASVGSYTIDTSHTQLVFRVNHFGTSNQFGLFTHTEGTFVIGEDISKSSIELEVAANSVFTALKKRDDHLKGPDYFDAKQFPSITFSSESVRAVGPNKVLVAGSLSLHGVTKPLEITLEHGGSGADPAALGGAFRTGFNGSFQIKRSDFGIRYMPAALGDEIQVLVALEGTRND